MRVHYVVTRSVFCEVYCSRSGQLVRVAYECSGTYREKGAFLERTSLIRILAIEIRYFYYLICESRPLKYSNTLRAPRRHFVFKSEPTTRPVSFLNRNTQDAIRCFAFVPENQMSVL